MEERMKFIPDLSAAAAVLSAAALSVASASAAPSITFNAGSGALPTNVSVIENFDDYPAGITNGTGGYVFNTTSDEGARPAFGSTGNFGSVLSGGSYSIDFAPTSTLAFVLGSLDTYNSLTLNFADDTAITYNGGGIIGAVSSFIPDGNRTAGYANGVVSYSAGAGPQIVGARFSSSGHSFEFDNIAISSGAGVGLSAAPEPAAWALMIIGMGVVGAMLRRKHPASRPVAA
jgi:hypothetical protein